MYYDLLIHVDDNDPKRLNLAFNNYANYIAAVDEEGYIYLVEQWRYPFAEVVMELPAGKLERGEDPDLAAARRQARNDIEGDSE